MYARPEAMASCPLTHCVMGAAFLTHAGKSSCPSKSSCVAGDDLRNSAMPASSRTHRYRTNSHSHLFGCPVRPAVSPMTCRRNQLASRATRPEAGQGQNTCKIANAVRVSSSLFAPSMSLSFPPSAANRADNHEGTVGGGSHLGPPGLDPLGIPLSVSVVGGCSIPLSMPPSFTTGSLACNVSRDWSALFCGVVSRVERPPS